MGHYSQPGWQPTNYSPKPEYKTVDAPLTHKTNVEEPAFKAVNFTPDVAPPVSSDAPRVDTGGYQQPHTERPADRDVQGARMKVSQHDPPSGPYFQPGTFFVSYDPGGSVAACPSGDGGVGRVCGSVSYMYRCQVCGRQWHQSPVNGFSQFMGTMHGVDNVCLNGIEPIWPSSYATRIWDL